MKDAFPIARYIPATIPSSFEQAHKKLKIKQPWLWFSSQFLGYLVLRPNDEFQKTLENVKSAISYNEVAISLHIRKGDKITEHEVEYIADEKFADAVQNVYKLKEVQEINSVRTATLHRMAVYQTCTRSYIKLCNEKITSKLFVRRTSIVLSSKIFQHRCRINNN